MEEQCASHRQGDIAGEGGGEGNHARRPEPVPLQLQLPEHEEEKHRSSLPPPPGIWGRQGRGRRQGGRRELLSNRLEEDRGGGRISEQRKFGRDPGDPEKVFFSQKKGTKKILSGRYHPPPGGVTGLEKKPGVERYGHKNYIIK